MSSINSLNIQSSAIQNHMGDQLSNATKLKLEALGIEPSLIKTEAQAQLIISQAEAAGNQNGNRQQQGGNPEGERLISEAKELAREVGVSVSATDSLKDIFEDIAETIQILAENPATKDFAQSCQEKLNYLSERADIVQNMQKNIFNEMNMISISNRLIHGL